MEIIVERREFWAGDKSWKIIYLGMTLGLNEYVSVTILVARIRNPPGLD